MASTIHELLSWYNAGEMTGAEFSSFLVYLLSPSCVDEVMSQVPAKLRPQVMKDAKSLLYARDNGEELLDFTFGAAPVLPKECEDALFSWLKGKAGVEKKWIAGEL